MQVWNPVGIELGTSGSAVRHASAVRHVTNFTRRKGNNSKLEDLKHLPDLLNNVKKGYPLEAKNASKN